MPVVPDGCADIIICNDDPPVLVGPDTRARWPHLLDGMEIVGLRFRPGALRSVLGSTATELVDTSLLLGEISSGAQRLETRLLESQTLQDRIGLLQQWVRERVRLHARDFAVIRACRLISRPGADLTEIARDLGWSTRKLRRAFLEACGYGPKTMQRILRVQQATRLARRSGRQLRLSGLAAASGFADQAHMSREFRSITGYTPAAYLHQSEPQLSRWLEADWPD